MGVEQRKPEEKYGHLPVQMAQVFMETNPHQKPDFIWWLREQLDAQAQAYGMEFTAFMAEVNGER